VHCSPAQTEFTATVAQTHTGQHAVRSKTMQDGDNYLKDDHFLSPERPWIDLMWAIGCRRAVQFMQITLEYELQFHVTVTTVTTDTARVVSFVLCLILQSYICW